MSVGLPSRPTSDLVFTVFGQMFFHSRLLHMHKYLCLAILFAQKGRETMRLGAARRPTSGFAFTVFEQFFHRIHENRSPGFSFEP